MQKHVRKTVGGLRSGSIRALALVSGLVAALVVSSAEAGSVLRLKAGTLGAEDLEALRVREGNFKNEKGERYFVVQFKEKITPQNQRSLTSLGAKIVRYLPDDALVIRASLKSVRLIEGSMDSVQIVVPYQASWKVSAEFEPASVFSAQARHPILIRLFPHEDSRDVVARLRRIHGVRLDVDAGRSILATVPRESLDAIASIEGIEWIQQNTPMQLFHMGDDEFKNMAEKGAGDYSDLSGYESGTKLMKFESAYQRGFDGRGQTVSMADTGLDVGDVDTIAADFSGRVPEGFIFGLFSKSWEDPMGHGTHVAGSVMGSGAISGGLIQGGARGAKLVPEGMWSPMLGNLSVPAKLRDLFAKAYDAGARIHTNSWGSPQSLGAYDGFAQQVDEFTFGNPDMLVIFAAGNSGEDSDGDGRIDSGSISSPGTAKNVLTVGASKNYVLKGGIQRKMSELNSGKDKWGVEPIASSMLSENAQGLAAFSSRGPTKDGRIKPEIVAPGTNILSNRSHNPDAETLWGEYNGDYVWSGGTSMATPLTAGAAAVVRQYLVENRKVVDPSAALLKAVLIHTAFDLFPGQFGEVGKSRGQELLKRRPNTDEGYGRVDVERATDLGKALLVDDRVGLAAGEIHTYPIRVTGKSRLTATLVYTDAPAAAGAAQSLVNDLDLAIVDAAGKETSLKDRVNNSEMLEVEVTSGDYEVRVKGVNVPQGLKGKQPYALVLSLQ